MDKEYYVQYYVGIKKEENKLFYENKLFSFSHAAGKIVSSYNK